LEKAVGKRILRKTSMREKVRRSNPVVQVAATSEDAAVIIAIQEQYRRAQQAAIRAAPPAAARATVPPPPPVFAYEGSADAAMFAAWEAHRRQAFGAATTGSNGLLYVPQDDFPVLVSRTVITPYQKTFEGHLIRAVTVPLLEIVRMILNDPTLMYQIDPRKWEEIIAATYDESGQFDEVILTPRSGDCGRDVIAVKNGFGSVRLIESVKRYRPGTKATAEDVQALLGVLHSDPQASKGIISTTWEFAPKIAENNHIMQYVPHRLEMVNGTALVERLKEYTNPVGARAPSRGTCPF
jgi:restriction system protein